MFKFVVVCALIGAAVAEPDPAWISSYGLSTSSYIPTLYNNYAYSSPYVQPSHIAYNAPLAHLIKKRSLLAATYAAAPYTTYSALSPLTTSYATYPTAYTSPLYTTAAHFIKKRSATLLPSTYSYNYAASPLYTSNIAATSYISSPYVSSFPLAYSTPFIKK